MSEEKALREIAAALYEPGTDLDVTGGLYAVARAIGRLGKADAATPMGGTEALGLALKEGPDGAAGTIATALVDLAAAIRDSRETR